jgi:hypothetical protein
MEVIQWLGDYGIHILEAIGIIGGLFFSAYTTRRDEKALRISNLIAIAAQYREIWKEMYHRPELARVLETKVNLAKHPISAEERLFVNLLILHLDTVYQATNEGLFSTVEGMQKDINEFFSLPIPQNIWESSKVLQNSAFVKFIEESRNQGPCRPLTEKPCS